MKEPTLDPGVWIVERGVVTDGVPLVVYEADDGRRWEIFGECIACGECEVGIGEEEALERSLIWQGPVGTPLACVETDWTPDRLDSPVTPEISAHPHCTLSGRWLK